MVIFHIIALYKIKKYSSMWRTVQCIHSVQRTGLLLSSNLLIDTLHIYTSGRQEGMGFLMTHWRGVGGGNYLGANIHLRFITTRLGSQGRREWHILVTDIYVCVSVCVWCWAYGKWPFSKRELLLPLYGPLFSISSMCSFICSIQQAE